MMCIYWLIFSFGKRLGKRVKLVKGVYEGTWGKWGEVGAWGIKLKTRDRRLKTIEISFVSKLGIVACKFICFYYSFGSNSAGYAVFDPFSSHLCPNFIPLSSQNIGL